MFLKKHGEYVVIQDSATCYALLNNITPSVRITDVLNVKKGVLQQL